MEVTYGVGSTRGVWDPRERRSSWGSSSGRGIRCVLGCGGSRLLWVPPSLLLVGTDVLVIACVADVVSVGCGFG